jgi:flagellar M-ring protein FliF
MSAASNLPLLAAARRLDQPRRLTLIAALLITLVLVVALVRWAVEPAFVPLFRDLPLDQTGRVTDRLGSAGIQFHLSASGSAVEVPAPDLARARVLLAKEGLPRTGHPGLELFDTPNWGMTEFTQRVTYRRALEGELATSIRTLQGIEDAQVHVTLSESSPLRRLDRPAEAVVVVTLRGGTPLSRETVEGITHLVSSSVEQLQSDHVTVLDDTGRMLTAAVDDSTSFGSVSRQLEMQRAVEFGLQAKVERLLTTVIGPDQARVQVAAQLDFARVDRTTESFNPDGQVLQNEQRIETSADTGTDPAETPSTSVTNNYQNSREVESVTGTVGTVTRLTVAVAINATPPGGARARASDELAQVERLVRDAVGLDSVRGDRLTVTALPFESPVATAAATAAAAAVAAAAARPEKFDMAGLAERLARPLVALIGLLVVFLLGRGVLRSSRGGATGTLALPAILEAPEPALPILETRSDPAAALKRRLTEDSSAKPEAAVRVLRAWMAES